MGTHKKMIVIMSALFFSVLHCDAQPEQSSRIILLPLSPAVSPAKSIAALKNEQARQAAVDVSDKRSAKEIENQTAPNLFTQSQAQLQLSDVRAAIAKEFGNAAGKTGSDKVTPYINIIFEALAKEAKYKDNYAVFYHATSTKWAVVADLFTQLYAYFNPAND